MLSVDYDEEKGGWQELKIVPYAPFEISPAAQSLHYGQAVFEGLKAYKHNGEVVLFRPDQNFKRINDSLARLEMPKVDEELLLEGLKNLLISNVIGCQKARVNLYIFVHSYSLQKAS